MNPVKRFFKKYLFSSLLILLAFLMINAGLLVGVLVISWNRSTDPDIPISQIAGCIHTDKHGTVYADEMAAELLTEKSSWAMVLDGSGEVIWEEGMPSNLPRQYSAMETAKFSRWYLEKYPVLTQEVLSGLLVIGCPQDSIVKYNFVTDANYIRTAVWGVGFVVIANVVLLLLLFWYNTRKVERAVAPILNGIDVISHGAKISLSESGELSEINEELNRAGAYILKKDVARTEWISGISHDIRTPLSIILGYAGQLEEDAALPEEARAQAGLIRTNGEKLRSLVTDLNLTSKLEYSMQPLRRTRIDLVELARQALAEYWDNNPDGRYSFELNVPEDCGALYAEGDQALLLRMLDNLIGNAIRHNPNGCHILIDVTRQKSSCVIRITDNGVGFGMDHLEALNRGKFQSWTSTETHVIHGLGLRLSAQIIEAHGGHLSFANQPAGGCVVTISIPLAITLINTSF